MAQLDNRAAPFLDCAAEKAAPNLPTMRFGRARLTQYTSSGDRPLPESRSEVLLSAIRHSVPRYCDAK